MDEGLSRQFAGQRVDAAKLRANGWIDQGSAARRRFLPAAKSLWAIEYEPAFESCEPIKLYVILRLSEDFVIDSVETVVARALTNGKAEELPLPIRHPDDEFAKEHIRSALPEATLRDLLVAAKRAAAAPVSVPDLIGLIGQPDSSPEAQALVVRFGLRESATVFGEGSSWTCSGSRLEFQTDARRRITTVFLKPIASDQLAEKLPANGGRMTVRSALGAPTRSADDHGWDRFDGDVVLHVTYSGDGASATMVTVMAHSVAP